MLVLAVYSTTKCRFRRLALYKGAVLNVGSGNAFTIAMNTAQNSWVPGVCTVHGDPWEQNTLCGHQTTHWEGQTEVEETEEVRESNTKCGHRTAEKETGGYSERLGICAGTEYLMWSSDAPKKEIGGRQ